MKAIIFGLLAVFFYGAMVGIQSLIGMFRYDKSCWPLAFGYIAYFLFVPLTLCIPGLYPSMSPDDVANHSLWKVCLLLLLVCMWFILGFFIKASYLRITTGESYWKPRDLAWKRIKIGAATFAVGTIVWTTGLFGYLDFLQGWWEKSTIILSLYLMAQGLILIVRNFKYLKNQPKEKIKTAPQKNKGKNKNKKNNAPETPKKSSKPAYQHISYKGQKKQKAPNSAASVPPATEPSVTAITEINDELPENQTETKVEA